MPRPTALLVFASIAFSSLLCDGAADQPPPSPASYWVNDLRATDIQVILNTSKYAQEYSIYNSRYWNLAYSDVLRPKAFVLPTTPEDLVTAVKTLNRARVKWEVRAGGHSYERASSIDAGAVIDLQFFNKTEVDTENDYIIVGGGQRQGQVYLSVLDANRSIMAGSCPSVGLSGFMLGGGYGHLARKLGWSVDSIVSAKAVTPDGELITAGTGPGESKDLLWALAGGGGGHAIVYEWTLRMHPAPQNITLCSSSWNTDDVEKMRPIMTSVLTSYMKLKPWALPSEFPNSRLFISRNQVEVYLTQWEAPSSAAAEALLQGAGLVNATYHSCEALDWPTYVIHMTNYSGTTNWGRANLTTPELLRATYDDAGTTRGASRPNGEFKPTSMLFNKPLGPEAVDAFVDTILGDSNPNGRFLLLSLGGALNDRPSGATALPYRNESIMLMDITADWPNGDEKDAAIAWLAETVKTLQPFSSGHSFVNFLDCSNFRNEAELYTRYFGSNAARVRQLKRKFDPKGRLPVLCPTALVKMFQQQQERRR